MAEIVGTIASAITLAGVLKSCLDAFDLFQTARKTDVDAKRLLVRLNIERCRLYTWGEAMGLTTVPQRGQKSPLNKVPLGVLVKDTLDAIMSLFQDSERLRSRYGCKEIKLIANRPPDNDYDGDPIIDLAATFSNYHVTSQPLKATSKNAKTITKIRWAVHDRKKFTELIHELKSLVDGLQSITDSVFATVRQHGMLRFGIQQISSINTLEAIGAACVVDYPDVSDAASVKLDVLTVSAPRRDEIQAWIDDLDPLDNGVIPGKSTQVYHRGENGNLSDLDMIVIEYLTKRGFTDTASILHAESWIVNSGRKNSELQIPGDANSTVQGSTIENIQSQSQSQRVSKRKRDS